MLTSCVQGPACLGLPAVPRASRKQGVCRLCSGTAWASAPASAASPERAARKCCTSSRLSSQGRGNLGAPPKPPRWASKRLASALPQLATAAVPRRWLLAAAWPAHVRRLLGAERNAAATHVKRLARASLRPAVKPAINARGCIAHAAHAAHALQGRTRRLNGICQLAHDVRAGLHNLLPLRVPHLQGGESGHCGNLGLLGLISRPRSLGGLHASRTRKCLLLRICRVQASGWGTRSHCELTEAR